MYGQALNVYNYAIFVGYAYNEAPNDTLNEISTCAQQDIRNVSHLVLLRLEVQTVPVIRHWVTVSKHWVLV